MISLEQWRAAIGCYSHRGVSSSVVTVTQGCDVFLYWLYSFAYWVTNSINIYQEENTIGSVFLLLLLVLLCCGDIETNPGPVKQCPECSCMVHVRKHVCECGFSFRLKPDIQNTIRKNDVQHVNYG